MNVIIDDLKERQKEFRREIHFSSWSDIYYMTSFRLRFALKALKRIRYTADRGVVAVDGWLIREPGVMTTKALLATRAVLRAYLDGVENARRNPVLPLQASELSEYGRLVNSVVKPNFDLTFKLLQDVMAFLDKGVRVSYDGVNDALEFPGATADEVFCLYTQLSRFVAMEDQAFDSDAKAKDCRLGRRRF